MFSLDFALFHDNMFIVFFIFFFYILYQQKIFSLIIFLLKIKKVILVILSKEMAVYSYNHKTVSYFNYFNSWKFLSEIFFLSHCQPIILNYSYLKF